jgi:hypothetical protein
MTSSSQQNAERYPCRASGGHLPEYMLAGAASLLPKAFSTVRQGGHRNRPGYFVTFPMVSNERKESNTSRSLFSAKNVVFTDE